MSTVSFVVLFIKPISIRPSVLEDTSFEEVCSWLKNNTNEDTVVQSEPFSNISTELRLFCDKNIFQSRIDSSQVIFNRQYALEVFRRTKIVEDLSADGSNIQKVLSSEDIDYLISNSKIGLKAISRC